MLEYLPKLPPKKKFQNPIANAVTQQNSQLLPKQTLCFPSVKLLFLK